MMSPRGASTTGMSQPRSSSANPVGVSAISPCVARSDSPGPETRASRGSWGRPPAGARPARRIRPAEGVSRGEDCARSVAFTVGSNRGRANRTAVDGDDESGAERPCGHAAGVSRRRAERSAPVGAGSKAASRARCDQGRRHRLAGASPGAAAPARCVSPDSRKCRPRDPRRASAPAPRTESRKRHRRRRGRSAGRRPPSSAGRW